MAIASNSDIGCLPGCSKLNNVISFLERHRAAIPERIAFQWVANPETWKRDPNTKLVHEHMSYGKLCEYVESAASGLISLGIGAGDRVFIFMPMSAELYVAMFAVQRIGAIAVFLDSWARRDQLAMCARQVNPKGFIGTESALALADEISEFDSATIRILAGTRIGQSCLKLDDLIASNGKCPIQAVEPDHTALVTFTTGSSGTPKGARRTHRFLAAQHRALDLCIPYQENDVDLAVFPIFLLNNIAGGVTSVIPAVDLARPEATDGALLASQIKASRATTCTLSPSLLRNLTASANKSSQLNELRRVATGGAPVSSDEIAMFKNAAPNAELHVLYGSTEVEPIAHLIASKPNAGEGVAVGRIAANLSYRFLRVHRGPIELNDGDWAEWEVPAGELGELAICGEHVCCDYYNNPSAFRATKIVDGAGNIWHRTGDICRLDSDGCLWFAGRIHNAICRDGQILLPVSPEIAMKQLPFVDVAAYLGLPDAALGERAAAIFTLRNGIKEIPEDPEQAVRKALATKGIVADDVICVAAIPLDPRHHSKVEYAALREQLLVKEGASKS